MTDYDDHQVEYVFHLLLAFIRSQQEDWKLIGFHNFTSPKFGSMFHDDVELLELMNLLRILFAFEKGQIVLHEGWNEVCNDGFNFRSCTYNNKVHAKSWVIGRSSSK